jgi:hypothetical protein
VSFTPRQLATAVLPWLGALLAFTGIGALAFGTFIEHRDVIRFSTTARPAIGRVQIAPRLAATGARQSPPNRSLIVVDDAELGQQVVSVYGKLTVGDNVPVLCLTSARRCMSAAAVREHLDLWPLTPLMASGAVLFVIAAALIVAARRRR